VSARNVRVSLCTFVIEGGKDSQRHFRNRPFQSVSG
jgi:hypothetical protein